MFDDTIAAISTPVGEGGIGIVRISGKDSFEIARKVFKPIKQRDWLIETHKIYYGHVVDPGSGKVIDEALVSLMKAPKTYTREDIVEINCHGGYQPLKETLRVVLSSGARMAEPGEFTKRAFLNGRIDLTQAESVIDIIRSKTEVSLKMAVSQLDGKLSDKIRNLQDMVLGILAGLEAAIDFPEDDIEEKTRIQMLDSADEIIKEMEKLLDIARTGKILREGVRTVIVGRPNVGKSSLLNALLRQERAIVTHIPGTTRDIIEEAINIKGIPLVLVDTAGLRETKDLVEKIGVKKTWELVNEADLILFVVDASDILTNEDKEILNEVDHAKTIMVVNKLDLNRNVEVPEELDMPVVKLSAKSGEGIEGLEDMIEKLFSDGKVSSPESVIISRARHEDAIRRAKKHIEDFKSSVFSHLPPDLLSIDVRSAWEALGEITGLTFTEDLLDRIFNDFCIGK